MPFSLAPEQATRYTVTLAHPTALAEFRAAARQLVMAGVPPQQVDWLVADAASGDLFASAHTTADGGSFTPIVPPLPTPTPALAHGAPQVPPAFMALCKKLVLHRHPARFALMYQLLWRMQRQPTLRHDPLDPDMLQAQRMARAVSREMHKMHAFVRFRPVEQADGSTVHMAWFEPDHYITEANAGFFIRRFTQMRWAILTPDATVHWDGQQLHTGPGAQRSDAPPADAGEALWLTYYRSTFNPARLKLAMMRKEMPVRYWRNLPEASLITELTQSAAQRTAHMMEAPATTPNRRIVGLTPTSAVAQAPTDVAPHPMQNATPGVALKG